MLEIQHTSSNDQSVNMTITSSALLQREALRILSQMKSKPIIAVDLDYTVRRFRTCTCNPNFWITHIQFAMKYSLFFSCGLQSVRNIHVVLTNCAQTMAPTSPNRLHAIRCSVLTRRPLQHGYCHCSPRCARYWSSV